MREMREKFGAEVKPFDYAFVFPRHYPGWDQPVEAKNRETGDLGATTNPNRVDAAATAPLALPAGKTPRYIEVKAR